MRQVEVNEEKSGVHDPKEKFSWVAYRNLALAWTLLFVIVTPLDFSVLANPSQRTAWGILGVVVDLGFIALGCWVVRRGAKNVRHKIPGGSSWKEFWNHRNP
jgi:hypothetical protein